MPRIDPVPREQYEPLFGADAPLHLQIYSHAPLMAQAMADWSTRVYRDCTLDPRLMELVRLRVAFHNQCRSCMATRYNAGFAAGVDEDLVCSLEKPYEADDLTPAEISALRYADLMCTNHLAVNDAVLDDLRVHFTETGLVELGMLCAMTIGCGRLAATMMMVEDLPERYREDGVVTPWGATEAEVVRA
jgi:AhpD family alkylhydroperoxidase